MFLSLCFKLEEKKVVSIIFNVFRNLILSFLPENSLFVVDFYTYLIRVFRVLSFFFVCKYLKLEALKRDAYVHYCTINKWCVHSYLLSTVISFRIYLFIYLFISCLIFLFILWSYNVLKLTLEISFFLSCPIIKVQFLPPYRAYDVTITLYNFSSILLLLLLLLKCALLNYFICAFKALYINYYL
jgi:hypothetical protein